MAFCLQLPLLQIPLKKAPPPFNISFPRHQLKLSDSRSFLPSLRSSSPSKTLKCFAQRQSTQQVERLFSNLNQATLKREPGSLSSAIFLVAGTTVGAGILAIPAVTQEAGFLASAITCILCWMYMVVTGLLVAEVNVNTMCELGSGGVSLVSMAMRTLGKLGVQVACWSYIFIHYALLVAYVARSSDILTNFLGIPLYELQLFCYCFSVIETDESIFSVFLTCSLEFCIPLYGFSFKGRGNPFMLIAFFYFCFLLRDIPLNELCLVLYWLQA
eukprot:TRINITY_DN3540_c0_g1_i17.p1 TRINITY_DN3540_c0_g1~~TRINITY_DN3540_c0_g1_i17.p1  ORF type:complete len:291 (+),score=43.50 TRINITY_DN3540_c0_g1_i17:59-874(+)